jgi:hypothetical protein
MNTLAKQAKQLLETKQATFLELLNKGDAIIVDFSEDKSIQWLQYPDLSLAVFFCDNQSIIAASSNGYLLEEEQA